jgi:nucleoside-diphosphate-sugar epimerase
MRIFLTGATGYIGSAVLDALVRAGHEVTALVRDNEKAARVAERGAHPVLGSLAEPDFWKRGAEGHDGYVHTALDGSSRAPAIDRTALDVLTTAVRRPRTEKDGASAPRFLIYTSGVWVIGNAPEPVDEDVSLHPTPLSAWRAPHEELVLQAAGHNVRTAIIRPGVVYGGSRGIVGDIFRSAVNGLVRVIGEGSNRWALVYDRDLADLYVKLVANADASGVYHATDEGDERVNDLVEAISPYLNTRPDVRHVPIEEARTKMGPYADALALDQVVRSPRARALGWSPMLHSVAGNAARLLEEWRRGQEQ